MVLFLTHETNFLNIMHLTEMKEEKNFEHLKSSLMTNFSLSSCQFSTNIQSQGKCFG